MFYCFCAQHKNNLLRMGSRIKEDRQSQRNKKGVYQKSHPFTEHRFFLKTGKTHPVSKAIWKKQP
jgi:hypothetical protein